MANIIMSGVAMDNDKVNWGEDLRQKMEFYKSAKTGANEDVPSSISVIFSVGHTIKDLAQVLGLLEDFKICLSHLESRSLSSNPDTKEYFATLEVGSQTKTALPEVIEKVRECVTSLEVVQWSFSEDATKWFPRTLEAMNQCLTRSLYAELEPSHPGANDLKYMSLRKKCWDIAQNYQIGTPIPRIEYTDSEISLFGTIYGRLKTLYPTNACEEFNEVFPDMVKECDIREDNIPQLEDVSNFVKKRSGFVLRPVSALLSSRDFLSALAFRVFPATQYLRHHSNPFLTPEPDLCHEILGHCSLLANEEFAQFSQEIGLASLGVSDKYVEQLSTLYWFTVEFGVCQEQSGRKAYGAGLLSSVAEIQHFLTDESSFKPFDPDVAVSHPYPMTGFQTTYFLAKSFANALRKFREFAAKIPRAHVVRYNPYTRTIDVLNSKKKLMKVAEQINGELNQLMEGIAKM